MLATGLSNIAQIRSTTLHGGGGGGGSVGGGGGGSSILRNPTIDSVPGVSPEERNERNIQLQVVVGDDGEFSRVLADDLRIVSDDEDVVLFGDNSRQAIGV